MKGSIDERAPETETEQPKPKPAELIDVVLAPAELNGTAIARTAKKGAPKKRAAKQPTLRYIDLHTEACRHGRCNSVSLVTPACSRGDSG